MLRSEIVEVIIDPHRKRLRTSRRRFCGKGLSPLTVAAIPSTQYPR